MIHMMQGLITAMLAAGILKCIKKLDEEHGLPGKISVRSWGIFFCSGITMCEEEWICRIAFLFFISCLAAMAYTDYYSHNVYPFFCLLVMLIGIVLLVWYGEWKALAVMAAFWLFVYFGKIVTAYASGDVDLYMMSAPYILLLVKGNPVLGTGLLMMYFAGSMTLAAVCMLIRRVINKKAGGIAMAPVLYVSVLMLFALKMIEGGFA